MLGRGTGTVPPEGSPPVGGSRVGRRRFPLAGVTVLVLCLGLAVTAALATVAKVVDDRNETRLLALQTGQAAAALHGAIPGITTKLTAAAMVAEASDGTTALFRAALGSSIGPKKSFSSASLWRVTHASARRLAALGPGVQPNSRVIRFLVSARGSPKVQVLGRLSGPHPALWYAATVHSAHPRFTVFAQSLLPADHHATLMPGPFSELHFALYLGRTTDPAKLMESDVRALPLSGPTDRDTIPFGSTELTLVATPAGRLGGGVSASLWWIVAAVGTLLSVAAAATAERLIRRRRIAEELRARIEALHAEQRGIAETLQRALLPKALPTLPGVTAGARYVPGTSGAEIGGDWYDVVSHDDGCLFFVIGDVSGRGIPAAAVMASLRFAIRGFISEGHSPDAVLARAARLLDLRADGHFATVLCGLLDVPAKRLVVSNAGHLPPVLLTEGADVAVLSTEIDPPIGIPSDHSYRSTTVQLPAAGTLLLYTDGLIERRGENLDQSLDRFLSAVPTPPPDLETLLDRLIDDLIPHQPTDDAALVGLEWT